MSLRSSFVSFGSMTVNCTPTQSSTESLGRHELSPFRHLLHTHRAHTGISPYSRSEQVLPLTVLRICVISRQGGLMASLVRRSLLRLIAQNSDMLVTGIAWSFRY